MLIKAKDLKGYKLNSLTGDIGSVKEFYFDDKHWTIRYLIADSGNWLTGRLVLISPYALLHIRKDSEEISINLSKKQIEQSPDLETDKPVSKQFEESYYGYYEWPVYWVGPYIWGSNRSPAKTDESSQASTEPSESWDPHLRSTDEVRSYHIQAPDGEVGHIEDFIIDDETWTIRYLIINTHNWWPGESLLISPIWIDRVSWVDQKVYINIPKETIKESPVYSKQALVTREYEDKLYRHYHKPQYWADDPTVKTRTQ